MARAGFRGVNKIIYDALPKQDPFQVKEIYGDLPQWVREKHSKHGVGLILAHRMPVEKECSRRPVTWRVKK